MLHVLLCGDCQQQRLPLPPPSEEAAKLVVDLVGDPRYQQMIRRLGGYGRAPQEASRALDTLALLTHDRAEQRLDRAQRAEVMRRLLTHKGGTASGHNDPNGPTPRYA